METRPKIKVTTKRTCTLRELELGSFFIYQEDGTPLLFQLIESFNKEPVACKVQWGYVVSLEWDTEVEPVNVTITVQPVKN